MKLLGWLTSRITGQQQRQLKELQTRREERDASRNEKLAEIRSIGNTLRHEARRTEKRLHDRH